MFLFSGSFQAFATDQCATIFFVASLPRPVFPVLVSEGGPKFEKFSSSMAGEFPIYAQRVGGTRQVIGKTRHLLDRYLPEFNNMIDSKFSSMFDAYSLLPYLVSGQIFNPHTRKPVAFLKLFGHHREVMERNILEFFKLDLDSLYHQSLYERLVLYPTLLRRDVEGTEPRPPRVEDLWQPFVLGSVREEISRTVEKVIGQDTRGITLEDLFGERIPEGIRTYIYAEVFKNLRNPISQSIWRSLVASANLLNFPFSVPGRYFDPGNDRQNFQLDKFNLLPKSFESLERDSSVGLLSLKKTALQSVDLEDGTQFFSKRKSRTFELEGDDRQDGALPLKTLTDGKELNRQAVFVAQYLEKPVLVSELWNTWIDKANPDPLLAKKVKRAKGVLLEITHQSDPTAKIAFIGDIHKTMKLINEVLADEPFGVQKHVKMVIYRAINEYIKAKYVGPTESKTVMDLVFETPSLLSIEWFLNTLLESLDFRSFYLVPDLVSHIGQAAARMDPRQQVDLLMILQKIESLTDDEKLSEKTNMAISLYKNAWSLEKNKAVEVSESGPQENEDTVELSQIDLIEKYSILSFIDHELNGLNGYYKLVSASLMVYNELIEKEHPIYTMADLQKRKLRLLIAVDSSKWRNQIRKEFFSYLSTSERTYWQSITLRTLMNRLREQMFELVTIYKKTQDTPTRSTFYQPVDIKRAHYHFVVPVEEIIRGFSSRNPEIKHPGIFGKLKTYKENHVDDRYQIKTLRDLYRHRQKFIEEQQVSERIKVFMDELFADYGLDP